MSWDIFCILQSNRHNHLYIMILELIYYAYIVCLYKEKCFQNHLKQNWLKYVEI